MEQTKKEFDIVAFASEYANERLDNYLKQSELEIEDYKIIADSQAEVGRGGRKKIQTEDQEFIDSKQKYLDLFSTEQFRQYYVENLTTIFNDVEPEVLEYLQFIRKVDKILYGIEDKVETLVTDYANAMTGQVTLNA